MNGTAIKPVSGQANYSVDFSQTSSNSFNTGYNSNSINLNMATSTNSVAGNQNYQFGLYAFFAKNGVEDSAQMQTTQSATQGSNGAWSSAGARASSLGTYSSNIAGASRGGPGTFAGGVNSTGGNNFLNNGIPGSGNQGFTGIPNDGKSDPLYDASKHSLEENLAISNMMTIMNSSSSSQTSKADSVNGEKFTAAFSKSILAGNSLQDTIRGLDGKEYGSNQTSQAYNTERMSKDPISSSNKANGTAIILRGSNDGVASMMAKDEQNLRKAYESLGLDVKVVHSEKEFEQALMSAREQAITDKANGQESILATHVISHGLKTGGEGGKNSENAYAALAMKDGGLYHEKDIMGDIAGALAPGEGGDSPFAHSYNSFTACHSGGFDNKQTLAVNGSGSGASSSSNSNSGGLSQSMSGPEKKEKATA